GRFASREPGRSNPPNAHGDGIFPGGRLLLTGAAVAASLPMCMHTWGPPNQRGISAMSSRHSLSPMGTLMALSLLVCSACAVGQPPPLPIRSAQSDPVFDQMLKPQQRGYLGADGAASVEIAPGRVLWIFGDTTLGTGYSGSRKGPMIRNSIAIQDMTQGLPGTVEYYWNLEDKLVSDFFTPESWADEYWYWPGCGINH